MAAVSASRNGELAPFMPAEGLDAAMPTARDPIPHRGLIADLDTTDDVLLEEPEDTASDDVPAMDRTVPIAAAALEALLMVDAESTDSAPMEGVLLESSDGFDMSESTEVDLGSAADVAAGLLGTVAPQPAPAPTPARPRPAPPPVGAPRSVPLPPPHDRRPVPRAPSISMTPEVDLGVQAAMAAPAGVNSSYAAPMMAEPEDEPRVRPVFLVGLAALPFLVFFAWWLG